MMIRINGEYLDFNDDIEIEDRIKLFDNPEQSKGSFSYDFFVSITNKNLKALGLPFPDTVKSIYQNVACEIVDDSGFKVYTGSLRVGTVTDTIQCTFFGGNTDWFGQLSEPLSSLPLYKYDIELTETTIQNSWSKVTGITFPILDAGALITRSFSNLKIEDFVPMFYVKTVFNDIFNPLGIKLEGDLLEDSLYNSLAIASNGKSENDIKDRSTYVNKTDEQLNFDNVNITFQDDSTFPYFDGALDNFSTVTGRYTADIKMRVDVSLTLQVSAVSGGTGISIFNLNFDINGVSYAAFSYQVNSSGGTLSKNIQIPLEQGDYLTIRTDRTSLNNLNIHSGSLRITPAYLYKVFGVSSLPAWTQGEFVSNILKIFNVLPSYNPNSKTLTLDLFNKIKDKEPIDLSTDIVINEVDYADFVSSYGKNNIFSYQEGSDEDLVKYNISNFISYGSGNITIDNDFIENEVDVLDSDFTSPLTYLNGAFDMSMERINFVELDEIDDKNITGVTDSSGTPRFQINNADDLFIVGDLVSIDTDIDTYNGEWVINAVTSSYITVNGLSFDVDATGTAALLRHKFSSDGNVYLMAVIPNTTTTFFSSKSTYTLEDSTSFSSTAIAYFNILSNGRQINTKYKQSLSFGSINNPLNYQRSMLDTYWPIFQKVLNDPVMLRANGYFNRNKFSLLRTFLRPVRVRTNQTNNLYYLNSITGYKNGSEPCEVELIKL